MENMKMPIQDIVDFPYGDTEGDVAREGYKKNEYVLEIKRLMEAGWIFDPILVRKNKTLIDGIHRLTALKLLGRKEVDVEFE